MSDEHDRPIVERQFSVVNTDSTVTATIHGPQPDPKGDWNCRFRLQGALDKEDTAHGIDSLSAFLNALEGVRVALKNSGLVLAWVGGDPGDVGIPRTVPALYGRWFAEKIERYIDRQIEAVGQFTKALGD